jgi:hypothetical protein
MIWFSLAIICACCYPFPVASIKAVPIPIRIRIVSQSIQCTSNLNSSIKNTRLVLLGKIDVMILPRFRVLLIIYIIIAMRCCYCTLSMEVCFIGWCSIPCRADLAGIDNPISIIIESNKVCVAPIIKEVFYAAISIVNETILITFVLISIEEFFTSVIDHCVDTHKNI